MWVNFKSPYLLDLRSRTLDLEEPGIRVIDAVTGEHVASVLPDEDGLYDARCMSVVAEMIRQLQAH